MADGTEMTFLHVTRWHSSKNEKKDDGTEMKGWETLLNHFMPGFYRE